MQVTNDDIVASGLAVSLAQLLNVLLGLHIFNQEVRYNRTPRHGLWQVALRMA